MHILLTLERLLIWSVLNGAVELDNEWFNP